MKFHIKAALLSAFVLPGLGQFIKGDRIKGTILIVLVNIFILAALIFVLQGMGELLASARFSGMAAAEQVMEALESRKGPAVRIILAAFTALWVYGVIDALVARGPGEKRDGN
jgi:Na+-transporting methylmalonyl-CoA/oxaloacetate decarboxylase gamma subunit